MNKRKKEIGQIIVIVLLCILLFFTLFQIVKAFVGVFGEKSERGFLASTENKIQLYDFVDEKFKKIKKESRGTKVSIYEKDYHDSERKYTKIKLANKIYYVEKGFTTTEKNKIVKEDSLYVKTNAVLYYPSSSFIICSLKKGTFLTVTGYLNISSDGSVDMYRVKVDNKEGYIYSKYTASTKEEALQNYNENGIYDIHKIRGNTYGGGSASSLDYYPFSKGNFSSNKMPKDVRAFYINTSAISRIDDYIKLAKESNINAFVIDIKENKLPSYASKVMEEYSTTSYKKAVHSFDDYKSYVKRAIDEGFYVIGRISVFKDYTYAFDNPSEAILDNRTGNVFSYHDTYWPTVYSRKVWQYNVELAKEAVKEMGFHEIQFDYVRFPDQINEYEKNGSVDLRNTYNEDKASAIQQFLMYASDELHSVNAYISVDVFGESAGAHVTSYGQYFPAISNVVDVISAMPYPDHFDKNAYGFPNAVWENPYSLLTRWGEDVLARQKETSSPAILRTWIQAYDSTKEPYVSYDSNKIADQIRALYDSKVSSGYMTWNASSSLDKYKEISSAFKREYKNG